MSAQPSWLEAMQKGEHPAKKGKGAGRGDSGSSLKKMLMLTCRLSLANAQQSRAAAAVNYITLVIPKNCDVCSKMEEASRGYSETAKAKKDHRLGHIGQFSWLSSRHSSIITRRATAIP
eukprot:TRINITY_DN126374_c0_g1_i1.p2 TRINITY_DN126374_c0_g1~~TRINITY_DN126374_c0_g1_i1.p2  ORF type:complete len:119 (+),score=27.91 TRINITY_DN126374_c0_g1_i1:197-553(+)